MKKRTKKCVHIWWCLRCDAVKDEAERKGRGTVQWSAKNNVIKGKAKL